MAVDHAGSANHAVAADLQAARHDHAASNRGVVANHHVVRNLTLVINNHAVTDDGVVQRTTVDGRTGANLHAIANNYATQLWDLNPVAAIVRVAEAICANHRAGLDQAILADLNVVVNGDVGP